MGPRDRGDVIERAFGLKIKYGMLLGVAKAAPFFHLEGNAMAKSIGTIHSWREIPIPYRCEGCPYPKVGFVCYGKDGSCLRSDIQEIEARQASKSAG